MSKTVFVDKNNCTGCGQCAAYLPQVFRLDDTDLAEVHCSDGGSEEEIQNEMDSCPGECIHWKKE